MTMLFIYLACVDKSSPNVLDSGFSEMNETGQIDTVEQDDTDEAYIYTIPDLSSCDDVYETEHGSLCAIQPSRIDPDARDHFGQESIADQTLGFGYHVVAFPKPDANIRGVYVHFTGSMGRAYDQRNATFPSATILNEAMQNGLITIQLAYHNRYAVNSPSECIGYNSVNNCAGNVRREKITGEDLTVVVDVPIADSITQRMKTLIEYLNQQQFSFPLPIVANHTVHWHNLLVGGHSQGAGHALYISKYWDSKHTCLFGGPFDVADTVPSVPVENIADWYLDDTVGVDVDKIRGLISIDDINYDNVVNAYNILNMIHGTDWFSIQATEYSNSTGTVISGHSAAVHDPRFAEERYEMCFAYAL